MLQQVHSRVFLFSDIFVSSVYTAEIPLLWLIILLWQKSSARMYVSKKAKAVLNVISPVMKGISSFMKIMFPQEKTESGY